MESNNLEKRGTPRCHNSQDLPHWGEVKYPFRFFEVTLESSYMTSFSRLPPDASQGISNQFGGLTLSLPPAPSEGSEGSSEKEPDTSEHVTVKNSRVETTIDLSIEHTGDVTVDHIPAPAVENSLRPTVEPNSDYTIDQTTNHRVNRAVLRRLESALAEPDKTRVRLLEQISSDELTPKAVQYTLSILSPIPARELLSKDHYYQYAVNFALTYGSYVAPLWPHITGEDVKYSDSPTICTALGFILDTVEKSAPSQEARNARAISVLEKVLLNTDSLFRNSFIDLEHELLQAQLANPEGQPSFNSQEITLALEQTLCFLPVTASQRYRFHLGLTGD